MCRWTPYDFLIQIDHVFLKDIKVVFHSILRRCVVNGEDMTNLCCKIKYCILLVMMCKQNRRCPSLAIYATLHLQLPRKTKWHKERNFFLGDKKMFRNNLCELVDGQSGVAQVWDRLYHST